MKKSDPLFHTGHRRRLGEKLLADKITDYELLEFILTLAVPRRDMRPLARTLFDRFKSLHGVICAPIEQLEIIKGVGPAIIKVLKAMRMTALLQYKEELQSENIFQHYEHLTNYCKLTIGGKPAEEFHILYLTRNMTLIDDKLHTIGTLDYAMVYPREILRDAMILNAHSVLLVHNHPSGRAAFSQDDIIMTQEIKEILEKNQIGFFDHFVVTATGMHSIINSQLLNMSAATHSTVDTKSKTL